MMMWLSLAALILAAAGVGLAVWSLHASRRAERKRMAVQRLRAEHEQAAEVSRKAEEDTERALRRLPDGDEG